MWGFQIESWNELFRNSKENNDWKNGSWQFDDLFNLDENEKYFNKVGRFDYWFACLVTTNDTKLIVNILVAKSLNKPNGNIKIQGKVYLAKVEDIKSCMCLKI